MKLKTIIPLLILLLINTPAVLPSDNDERIDERVDSVLSIMTLEEKIGQLNQISYGIGWGPNTRDYVPGEYEELVKQGNIGSFFNAVGADFTRELQTLAVTKTRLKIPLIFGFDVIHGFRTTFPVPLAEASSWDTSMVKLSASMQALEASSAGVNWSFSPMMDIARDPRWGRIVEGSGEDPYLGSLMAAARVRGIQGDFSRGNLAACAKHFAAYGAAEGGKDYNTVDISERTLREIYLPPFKAAVEAGVQTLMSSFNEIAGVPSTMNRHLLTEILRDEWKFKGFVVSDWNSVGEVVGHGAAADLKEAAAKTINAGLDMDMMSRGYLDYLPQLVKEGKVSEETINTAVKRILHVKFLIGLFDDPFKYCSKEREKEIIGSTQVTEAALKMAQRSIVLLKNDKNTLPLKKDLKSVAVIGPLASNNRDPLGPWSGFSDTSLVVTVLEGIKTKFSNAKINYALGCKVDTLDRSGFTEAVEAAKKSDVVLLVLGEYDNMSGEAASRSTIELPGVQEELAKEIYKTGKPVIVILMNGRPLAVPWIAENIPAVVEAWFPGISCGTAIADILTGDYNPSGKLPVSFPRATGQIPVHYNYKHTGRPGRLDDKFSSKYIDQPLTPLYPFGFGLSYSAFSYSKIKLSSGEMKYNGTIDAAVNVKNTGSYDGEEVVQLYIRDLAASVTRPVKELKGFKKIFLKKGEAMDVTFTLSEKDLRFFNDKMEYTSEPGSFKLFIGTSSADVQEADFELSAQ